MELIVLNSNSLANGYILTNGNEALVIETGCKLMEVKKALDFNISIIAGGCSEPFTHGSLKVCSSIS
jgi:hypothetical protein